MTAERRVSLAGFKGRRVRFPLMARTLEIIVRRREKSLVAGLIVATEKVIGVVITRMAESHSWDGRALKNHREAVTKSIWVVLHERGLAPGIGERGTHDTGIHLSSARGIGSIGFPHRRMRNRNYLPVLSVAAPRAARARHELVQ